MNSPLRRRILAASALVAIVVAAALLYLVATVGSLRDAAARERRSREVTAATLTLRSLAIDLETGLRGYVLTADPRVLQTLTDARRRLPAANRRLQQLVKGDPDQEQRARELRALISSYITEYVDPVIGIVEIDPVAAQESDSTTEGKHRTDEIRQRFARVLAAEETRAVDRRRRVDREEQRAVTVAIGVLVLAVALVLGFGIYLGRAIARPVRRAAAGAGRVASGDFGIRLAEEGPGEVGELAIAFNAMARSLEDGRRQLVEQNAKLQESEQHKSELISIVSHELRTPLSSVLGFTQLLLQREVDAPTRRHYLGIIDTEARRLATLAEDFLDVQLLEEGRLELQLETLDLAELVRDQVGLFLSHSDTHRAVADLPETPVWVTADRDRLSQVVGNLLSNAIKYSPDGGDVHVALTFRNARVRLSIRDDGIGIPGDDQPRIFTKFYRGAAASTGIPGTGLGLSVARQIVERHGGEMGFESRPGRGSTFWVELPPSAEEWGRQAS